MTATAFRVCKGSVFFHQARRFVVWSVRGESTSALTTDGAIYAANFDTDYVAGLSVSKNMELLWERLRLFDKSLSKAKAAIDARATYAAKGFEAREKTQVLAPAAAAQDYTPDAPEILFGGDGR